MTMRKATALKNDRLTIAEAKAAAYGLDRDGVFDLAGELRAETLIDKGETLRSPAETNAIIMEHLQGRTCEMFLCLFLDTRHRLIKVENLFRGSIDGAAIYPRIVAEKALLCQAAAVIVAHNHPSGIAEPSLADQAITRRLKDALALMEIRLLDHFVVGAGASPTSMAERGMIDGRNF